MTERRIYDYVGRRFKSRPYGEFDVIGVDHIREDKTVYYNVRFVTTGTERVFSRDCIREGTVRDPYYPRIFGMFCLGTATTKGNRYIYQTWQNMLRRCYDPGRHNYNSYGGRGYTVCKRWFCFEYFLEDISKLPGYDLERILKGELVLDKDLLNTNKQNKVYSPDTTCWVPKDFNKLIIDTSTFTHHYDIYDKDNTKIATNVTLREATSITGYKLATLRNAISKKLQLGKGYKLVRIN